MDYKFWKVRLVCGEKKGLVVEAYDRIPAPDEDAAKLWGHKQAESRGLPLPHFVAVTSANEKDSTDDEKTADMAGTVV